MSYRMALREVYEIMSHAQMHRIMHHMIKCNENYQFMSSDQVPFHGF